MTSLNTIPVIAFESAEIFETWLVNNHATSDGLWIKIFKKDSGEKTISYAAALEVALCFGWIDGQKQSHDEQAWLQRFSPRRERSIWSKVNIGHVERLIKEEKMRPEGLIAVEKAKANGSWDKAYDSPSKMIIPDDFLKELSKNKQAEAFFKGLNKTNLFSIGFVCKPQKNKKQKRSGSKKLLKCWQRAKSFYEIFPHH